LTVHGRTRKQNKHLTGLCNWDAIKLIKESVNIPVIANGGLEKYEDVGKCLEYTKCDAVMSAEKLLEDPGFFSGNNVDLDDIAFEYLDIAKEIDCDFMFVRSHLFKLYYQACQTDHTFNEKLCEMKTIDDAYQIAEEIKDFRMVKFYFNILINP
jgi:tRNA-dihydrouridine synthase